jgi:hypothetical protein
MLGCSVFGRMSVMNFGKDSSFLQPVWSLPSSRRAYYWNEAEQLTSIITLTTLFTATFLVASSRSVREKLHNQYNPRNFCIWLYLINYLHASESRVKLSQAVAQDSNLPSMTLSQSCSTQRSVRGLSNAAMDILVFNKFCPKSNLRRYSSSIAREWVVEDEGSHC